MAYGPTEAQGTCPCLPAALSGTAEVGKERDRCRALRLVSYRGKPRAGVGSLLEGQRPRPVALEMEELGGMSENGGCGPGEGHKPTVMAPRVSAPVSSCFYLGHSGQSLKAASAGTLATRARRPASHPHLCPDTRTQKQPFSVCRARTLWSASEPREASLRPLEGSHKSLGCGERGESEFPHLEETHWSSVRLKLSLPAERASSTVLLNN